MSLQAAPRVVMCVPHVVHDVQLLAALVTPRHFARQLCGDDTFHFAQDGPILDRAHFARAAAAAHVVKQGVPALEARALGCSAE